MHHASGLEHLRWWLLASALRQARVRPSLALVIMLKRTTSVAMALVMCEVFITTMRDVALVMLLSDRTIVVLQSVSRVVRCALTAHFLLTATWGESALTVLWDVEAAPWVLIDHGQFDWVANGLDNSLDWILRVLLGAYDAFNHWGVPFGAFKLVKDGSWCLLNAINAFFVAFLRP